jgi:folate-binding protein YgfZ
MQATANPDRIVVALEGGRYLVIAPGSAGAALAARFAQVSPEWWTLAEVRAGLPLVTQLTQDQFVPQMANFELVGGIDFKKGCYPGQEVVARTQYLGKLKRRMYRGEVDAAVSPSAGQDLFGTEPQAVGMIVNAAPRPGGGYEFLAVIQSSSVEAGDPLKVGAADGPVAAIVPLPYAV